MVEIKKLSGKSFPPLLREIPNPPETLYLRGTMPLPGTKLLTVVGSRHMSRYGKDVCEYLIKGLAGYPVAIVSGLAIGIDATAHKAALDAGLPTIALPGSGLADSVLYPPSNRPLAMEILEAGGALLSEFEPDAKTMLHYFPQRNRIMAGMSDAVLIIEAGVQSGTLITARLAADYGRDLLIVPHSIFSEGGSGGHVFMKIGAMPVRSAEDILEALNIEKTETRETVAVTEEEKKVLQKLGEPIPRDELIRALGMETGAANVLLMGMELRGLIAESLGEIRKTI